MNRPADPRPVRIIDLETTGLHPELGHQCWEVAIIDWRPPAGVWQPRWEQVFAVEPTNAAYTFADEDALKISGFRERTAHLRHGSGGTLNNLAGTPRGAQHWSQPGPLAAYLKAALAGQTILAANPTFDLPMLTDFLEQQGQVPPWPWHYRVRDIQSLAWGYLNGYQHATWACTDRADPGPAVPPLDASTDELAVALGVDPGQFERHTALGDCRLAEAMLNVIVRRP